MKRNLPSLLDIEYSDLMEKMPNDIENIKEVYLERWGYTKEELSNLRKELSLLVDDINILKKNSLISIDQVVKDTRETKKMTIQEYIPKDKEQAKQLYSDLMFQEPTLSKLDDPHYKKFGYFDNELLGMIMLESSYLTLNIFNIHVSESARGKGVGSKLINTAVELAKKYDLHGVRVNCDKSNNLAQKFYLKNEFKYVGEVNCYDVENHTAVFFYKSVRNNL